MIRLDARLAAVAAMVRPGSVLADIGSDHAYLACFLVQSGTCPRAYACDISEGPLSRAKNTIARHGLSDRVEALLSDGLTALRDIRLDDIVVAGMGGEVIADILEADIRRPESTRYLLQPISKPERLRIWLYRNGFEIERERALVSGRFCYTVMRARFTGIRVEITPLFAWTGKIWDNMDDAARRYLFRVQNALRRATCGAGGGEFPALANQIAERMEAV